MPPGIVGYGVYVPRARLRGTTIRDTLGQGGGRGARSVAAHDEDTTSMAVEAARAALRSDPTAGLDPRSVVLATTHPVYADRTNATAIHAALGLRVDSAALDLGASLRSAGGALRWAAREPAPALAVLSDVQTGLPGSQDESGGGDAAAAFLFAEHDELAAEIVAEASVTGEFLDRWRAPGARSGQAWEERFGAQAYAPLIATAASTALQHAGIDRADETIVSSPNRRASAAAARSFDVARSWIDDEIGFCGAADAGVRLADALDRRAPGETILLVVAADGADAIVLRRGTAVTADATRARGAGGRDVSYASYLTWRGWLPREHPRRPPPELASAPPSARRARWKYSLVGSRCGVCESVHMPPQRICATCHAVDRMREEPMRERIGTVSTFTIDELAPSAAPPVIDVVVDFDGGGRLPCELADADADLVRIGDRVEMTFRRLHDEAGIANYFWKARKVDAQGPAR